MSDEPPVESAIAILKRAAAAPTRAIEQRILNWSVGMWMWIVWRC